MGKFSKYIVMKVCFLPAFSFPILMLPVFYENKS